MKKRTEQDFYRDLVAHYDSGKIACMGSVNYEFNCANCPASDICHSGVEFDKPRYEFCKKELEKIKEAKMSNLREGDMVYVSDVLEEGDPDLERVFLGMEGKRFKVAAQSDGESRYIKGILYETNLWKYAVPSGRRAEKEVKQEGIMKFRVGDRVEVIRGDGPAKVGMKGVVAATAQGESGRILVGFGSAFRGHYGLGTTLISGARLSTQTGWWMKEDTLKVLPTGFIYGQTVYDKDGMDHTFITYTPDGKMLAVLGMGELEFIDDQTDACDVSLYKDIFYATDPTAAKVMEMTVAEIEKALGHAVKVVK